MAKFGPKAPASDRSLVTQAEQLSAWFDEGVPSQTLAIQDLFLEHSAWFLLNRNEPAFSCEQAANVRWCLGQSGIPLARELKSYLGFFMDESGLKQKVAVHCRATHKLDINKIKKALGTEADFYRLQIEDEHTRQDHPGFYGLVNPFTLEINSMAGDLTLQIFDDHVFEGDELPPTMATNAGERSWSIEFAVTDLPKVISHRRFMKADVTEPANPFFRPSVGIVTGNSPESGILLWESINNKVRGIRSKAAGKLAGDIYLPKTIIRSIPAMGMTMELHLRQSQIWDQISTEIESLCQDLASDRSVQGKSVLTIACNTTPYFSAKIDEIADRHNVKFISIADAVEDAINLAAISRVALLGIGYVQRPEFSGYKRLFDRADLEIIRLSEEALSEIESAAFDVKRDRPIHECSRRLTNLLSKYELQEENVVIALTEISLIFTKAKWAKTSKAPSPSGKTRIIIDAIDAYASIISDIFLGLRKPPYVLR